MNETILLSTEYTVVIDTNSVSYSFAKSLCAYCTGIIDEENEGEQYADLFYLEQNIEDDENSNGLVAEVKNPFYGFIGQHLDEDNTYSPCCVWLNKNYGCNAIGKISLLTDKNYDEFNFPAPLSVGIFFDVEPTPELIQMIKDRSVKFLSEVWPKTYPAISPIKIEGYRLIIHEKYGKEKDL